MKLEDIYKYRIKPLIKLKKPVCNSRTFGFLFVFDETRDKSNNNGVIKITILPRAWMFSL